VILGVIEGDDPRAAEDREWGIDPDLTEGRRNGLLEGIRRVASFEDLGKLVDAANRGVALWSALR
jgi:hypothetical protein